MTWVNARNQRSDHPEWQCGNCGEWTGCRASLDGGPSPAWRPHKEKLRCKSCGEVLYDQRAQFVGVPEAVTLVDWWQRRVEMAMAELDPLKSSPEG